MSPLLSLSLVGRLKDPQIRPFFRLAPETRQSGGRAAEGGRGAAQRSEAGAELRRQGGVQRRAGHGGGARRAGGAPSLRPGVPPRYRESFQFASSVTL